MAGLNSVQETALGPLRTALLYGSTEHASKGREAARRSADAEIEAARCRAGALLDEARRAGRADAAAQFASEQARAQRAARVLVLEAERELHRRLTREALVAVRRLLSDPARRAALEAELRRQLGDQAVVRAAADGGLTAEAPGGRRIDASARTLVEVAAAALDLDRLWQA